MCRKAPWRSKGRGHHLTHNKWCNYPQASLLDSILAKRCAYPCGGPWGIPNTEPGKSRWSVKGNSEEMPHKSDSNYQEGRTLSVSAAESVMSDSVRPHRRQPTRLPSPWDSPGKNTWVGCHFLLQCMKVKSLSHVQLFATPWTAAYQAPPSMGFSRQEYWSGLPLPSPNLVTNTTR